MGEYENVATVKLQDAGDYDTKIIGGLVGTFHSFKELQEIDTINSIQLVYLRILFAISEDYITVLAVDPELSDEYYYKVVRTLLDCLNSANKRSKVAEADNFETQLQISVEMIFTLLFDEDKVNITYPDNNRSDIREKTNSELERILKEIFESHEKFFKRVIN
jgi:hypothetical protein